MIIVWQIYPPGLTDFSAKLVPRNASRRREGTPVERVQPAVKGRRCFIDAWRY
jgi:hypothetical protein